MITENYTALLYTPLYLINGGPYSVRRVCFLISSS